MVLKQGIKLPATDPVAIKSTLFGDSGKYLINPKYIKILLNHADIVSDFVKVSLLQN